MKYLIKDHVLEGYTWCGTINKKPFKKLVYLNDLIFKSVRDELKNGYKFGQYKSYMIQWLKHSRTRQRTVTYQYPNRNQQNYNYDTDEEDVELDND